MPVITTTHVVDRAGLDALQEARTDLVIESALTREPTDSATRSWVAERGPFRHYSRTLGPPRPLAQTSPGTNGSDSEAGTTSANGSEAGLGAEQRFAVAEKTSFTLAIPLWWPLVQPLMRRALRSPERTPRLRWWWPREVIAAQTLPANVSFTLIAYECNDSRAPTFSWVAARN